MGRFLQARGQGAPVPQYPRPPARFGCSRFHGAVQGATKRGLRVVLSWAGAGSMSPRVARFPASVFSCLAGSCPSSPGLPWHWAPLGGAQGCGFTGASLSSSTASLQNARLAWEPLQLPWAVARIPSHLQFSRWAPARENSTPACVPCSQYSLSTCDHRQAALRHQLGLLQFSSILTLPPWRWCQSRKLRAQCHQTVHPT